MYLKTLPGATCFLRREQDDDPSRYLKYFSDEDRLISVHIRPLGCSGGVGGAGALSAAWPAHARSSDPASIILVGWRLVKSGLTSICQRPLI
jgi:hypothetical protein